MAKKNFVAYGDAETLMTEMQDHLSLRPKTWSGTQEEWDELTIAERKAYDRADITDDSESGDVDSVPTENSPNLVTSGGVYSALSTKANSADLGTAAGKDYTTNVSPNNHSLVESNAVYSAINNALSSVYTPRGSITCAELVSSLLIPANVGNVYNTTDSGTTTADFMQGAGVTINAGDSVGIIQTGPSTYKFNLMGNTLDLHEYQKKDLTSAVEGATTVEGALDALNAKEKDDIKDVYAVMGQNGAKNLLPFPYKRGNETINGITSTVNADGTVILNGTATAATSFIFFERSENKYSLPEGKYTVSAVAESGTYTGTVTHILRATEGGSGVIKSDKNIGAEGTFNIPSEEYIGYQINIASGVSLTNLKIAPMIRLASDTDNTYVPYAPTNAKLNEEKMSYADNGVLGAKNILKNNLVLTTRNDVTYTPNSDGTFIANGTATANGGIQLNANIDASLIEGMRYKVSLDGIGADKDGTQNGIMMYVAKILNGANVGDVARSNKTGGFTDEFVYHKDSSFDNLYVGCYTFKNASFSNSTIKPMIRLASDSDDTYQPYAKTNKELTDGLVYSASETKTGKIWIDGKPIYRKVYSELSMESPSNAWQSWSVALPSGVGLLINSSVLRNDKTYCADVCTKLNPTAGTVDYLNHTFNSSTNDIRLIIEYTKTT